MRSSSWHRSCLVLEVSDVEVLGQNVGMSYKDCLCGIRFGTMREVLAESLVLGLCFWRSGAMSGSSCWLSPPSFPFLMVRESGFLVALWDVEISLLPGGPTKVYLIILKNDRLAQIVAHTYSLFLFLLILTSSLTPSTRPKSFTLRRLDFETQVPQQYVKYTLGRHNRGNSASFSVMVCSAFVHGSIISRK